MRIIKSINCFFLAFTEKEDVCIAFENAITSGADSRIKFAKLIHGNKIVAVIYGDSCRKFKDLWEEL